MRRALQASDGSREPGRVGGRRGGGRHVGQALGSRVLRAAGGDLARALDRVFRAGRYWIPHWYKPTHWLAYWDVFAWPDKKPRYGRGAPETWWADPAKAAAVKKG